MSEFLKAMETDGGKLCVIVFLLIFLAGVAAILQLSGHPMQEVGREALVGACSSLLALLYTYLKPGTPK